MAGQSLQRFPASRVLTFDVGALSRRRHLVAALLEVDVSVARARLREHRARTGERLSFTAWLIAVYARKLARYPTVQAWRVGPLWRAVPEGVDVSTLVEREVDGQRVPVPTVVRGAEGLDVAALTAHLEAARSGPPSAGASWLGGPRVMAASAFLMALLPGALRRLLWRGLLAVPSVARGLMGSAVLTSVGMMGQVRGWFVQTSIHPVSLGVGSIVRKAVVGPDDRVVPADVLHLTLLMDHDVVDGADMARFVAELSAGLEAGEGLPP